MEVTAVHERTRESSLAVPHRHDDVVLIVDDDPDVTTLFEIYLKSAGYNAIVAHTMAAAQRILDVQPVDAALIDMRLGDGEGLDLVSSIRARHGNDTAILVVTADTSSTTLAHALAAGAIDYVRKPIDDIELVARLEAALRTKRAFELVRHENDYLRDLARVDPVTTLANRRRFDEFTEQIRMGSDGTDTAVGVVMADLDRFKSINDRWGHAAGDDVLVETAVRLSKAHRSKDVVARIGGDEFAVVGVGISPLGLRNLANRLCDVIRETPMQTAAGPLQVTLSAGAALGSAEDIRLVIASADAALLEAKQAGRDQAVVADSPA
ncbi:MAG TPA: diguanylate cyclase [Acidimicrobiales bacterium]|jgi:two-component system cell cycle response regulator|nr:diguanylate cyclase [Acidimicrobiales bacterium]